MGPSARTASILADQHDEMEMTAALTEAAAYE
jgi:hypothetical protein